MSFYTKFQDVEATLTASSSASLVSTDSILVFCNNTKKPAQVPIGSVSAIQNVSTVATSNTTGTTIPGWGLTQVTASSSFAWLLGDPAQAGVCKTLFNTTSTSTANQVNFTSATGASTDGSAIVSVGFSASGAYFELQSISTGAWIVVGRSAAGAHSS